jgi:hypothetical protein
MGIIHKKKEVTWMEEHEKTLRNSFKKVQLMENFCCLTSHTKLEIVKEDKDINFQKDVTLLW